MCDNAFTPTADQLATIRRFCILSGLVAADNHWSSAADCICEPPRMPHHHEVIWWIEDLVLVALHKTRDDLDKLTAESGH